MHVDTYNWEHRRVIYATWERLPPEVRRALDHVRFTVGQHARKSYASAGQADIDIQRLPIGTEAAIAVVAHELGHIAGDHFRRLHSGEITEQEAEREADAYVRHWLGDRVLAERRHWTGR